MVDVIQPGVDPATMQRCWGLLAIVVIGCSGEVDGTGDGGNNGGGDGAVPGDGPRPDVPGGVGEPAELAGITLYHNEVRAAVQTATPLPAMEWDASLAQTAAAWVAMCRDTDAPIGLIDHNPNRSVGHPYYVGENVFGAGGTATAQQAVQVWASEGANYNYATNTCAAGKVCGHYTQIVWRTSVKLGCAKGTCAGLTYPNVIVCDYGPGGNLQGQKPY